MNELKEKKKITNAVRLLKNANITFDLIEYDPGDEIGEHFAEKAAEKMGIPKETSFKTLVAKGDKTGYMTVCVNAESEVDLKKLAKESGNKKAELIPTKDLLSVTGYIRGGVSPIGMKKKFPAYIDDYCLNLDKIVVSGGQCGTAAALAPAALADFIGAKICSIAEKKIQKGSDT